MASLFKKLLKNKLGQHLIEYSIIMILVIIGIIIMGPYVIRSINANIKGWEDSVADSLNDPMKTASAMSILGCVVVPEGWQDAPICGTSHTDCSDAVMTCSTYQRLSTLEYFPDGCECSRTPPPLTAKCTDDTTCCTPYTSIGPPPDNCGVNTSCPDGEMRKRRTCGNPADPSNPISDDICEYDAGCVFSCQGTKTTHPVQGYGHVCPGDESGLPDNSAAYSYVLDGECGAAKCQIRCAPSFYTNGSSCYCPAGMSVVSGVCRCADGFALQDGCGFGEC